MPTPITNFISRLARNRIVSPTDLRPCSATDIAALESKYAVTLPMSYRAYLETMGRDAGRLWRYDHFEGDHDAAMRLTEQERAACDDEGDRAELDRALGPTGLLIVGRLAEQYFFIRCRRKGDHPDSDVPVWYLNSSTWESREKYGSVFDLLNAIADECAEAVRGGYFGSE